MIFSKYRTFRSKNIRKKEKMHRAVHLFRMLCPSGTVRGYQLFKGSPFIFIRT